MPLLSHTPFSACKPYPSLPARKTHMQRRLLSDCTLAPSWLSFDITCKITFSFALQVYLVQSSVTAHTLRCVCWRNLSFLLDYRHEGRSCVSVIFLFWGANECLWNWLWGSENIKSIKYNVEKKRELTFINHFLGARQYSLFHLNFTVTLRGRYFSIS